MLLLDAGNSLTGDMPLSQESQGKTSVDAMNMMGYDAMALAVGDLALGLDALEARQKDAKFAFVSANLLAASTKQLVGQSYVVLTIGSQRVAIVGLTEAGEVEGFTITDPLAAARQTVPEAAKQADIVILLTHTPVSIARQIAAAVPGIDLIVTGGDEVLPAGEVTANGALIVHADVSSPGHAGRNMGIVTADFDAQGKLTSQTNSIIPISEDLPEDPDMAAWVAKATATQ